MKFLRLGLTAATVVYLAWISETALSPLFFHSPESAKIVLEVLEKDGRNLPHQLWINSVVVDGRLLRWDAIDHSTGWELSSIRYPLPPLVYKSDFNPAILTFSGKRFIAFLQAREWSGVIRVKRDGRTVQLIDVQAAGEQNTNIDFSDPTLPSSALVFVGALILFAGCAWYFGPVRPARTGVAWLVFFLCVLHLLYWACMPVGTNNDSVGYRETVSVFFFKGRPDYFPPGYPALLVLMGNLAKSSVGTWLTLAQHGMTVLTALWLYLLLRRFISEELAFLAALLAGSMAPALTVPQAIISETATSFAMVGALYYTVRSTESRKRLFLALAGLLIGWAATLRGVPLAVLLVATCLIYLSSGMKDAKRACAVNAIIALLIVMLPISWSWYKSGQAKFTNSTGFHLFNRVFREQRLVNMDGPATRRLYTLLAGRDPRDFHFWETYELGGLGDLTEVQLELLLRQASLEGIIKSPWTFLVYTFQLAWRDLVAPTDWIPPWADTPSPDADFENSRPLPVTDSGLASQWALETLHGLLWPLLCGAAIAGALLGLLSRRRLLVLALIWVPLGYMLLTACIEEFCPRYNAPIVPFVAALAMLPAEAARRELQQRHISDLPLPWRQRGKDRLSKEIAADGAV